MFHFIYCWGERLVAVVFVCEWSSLVEGAGVQLSKVFDVFVLFPGSRKNHQQVGRSVLAESFPERVNHQVSLRARSGSLG